MAGVARGSSAQWLPALRTRSFARVQEDSLVVLASTTPREWFLARDIETMESEKDFHPRRASRGSEGQPRVGTVKGPLRRPEPRWVTSGASALRELGLPMVTLAIRPWLSPAQRGSGRSQ